MTWPKMLVLYLSLCWSMAATADMVARHLTLPPKCFPVPAEQAVVCMSWRPLKGDFVEVNRIPFPQTEQPQERGT